MVRGLSLLDKRADYIGNPLAFGLIEKGAFAHLRKQFFCRPVRPARFVKELFQGAIPFSFA
jgi:hypothetical protein